LSDVRSSLGVANKQANLLGGPGDLNIFRLLFAFMRVRCLRFTKEYKTRKLRT
jgi:hypothetical protein